MLTSEFSKTYETEIRGPIYTITSECPEDMKQESNSIANQRQMFIDYVGRQGYNIAGEYLDDGVSGVSFDRPGFQQMLGDVTKRKINMAIVKDLSRLGRKHVGTGQYIEQIFPRMGVRFIAISDNYDSLYDDELSADMVPMINFFNESHAKQTSRKTRAAFWFALHGRYL